MNHGSPYQSAAHRAHPHSGRCSQVRGGRWITGGFSVLGGIIASWIDGWTYLIHGCKTAPQDNTSHLFPGDSVSCRLTWVLSPWSCPAPFIKKLPCLPTHTDLKWGRS